PFIRGVFRMTNDDKAESTFPRQEAHRAQQGIEALEAIVHRHEKADGFIDRYAPRRSHRTARYQSLRIVEAPRIDRSMQHVNAARIEGQVFQRMLPHHLA